MSYFNAPESTDHRERRWCRDVDEESHDVCSLYLDHHGDHASKHLKRYWPKKKVTDNVE